MLSNLNNNLYRSDATNVFITLVQAFRDKIWGCEIITEVGYAFYFKIFDTNQFESNPITYNFEVDGKDLRKLCESNNKHLKLVCISDDGDTVLTLIANHMDNIVRKDALLAVVKNNNTNNECILQMNISKNWFI